MRAAVLHARGDLRLEEVPVPEPGPGELLLRVETVGICGTDLTEYDHGPVITPLEDRHPVTGHLGPIILGHELSGIVEASRAEGFTEGELVASVGVTSCGTCVYCTGQRMSICERYWAVGLHRNGGLASYCTVPASTCVSAETWGLTPDAAALVQPMSIAQHAIRRAGLSSGEQAVVIGTGGIGAFLTYIADEAGATVVACDLDQDRLSIASALGAEHTVPADEHTDLLAEINKLGISAEVVFEATGTKSGLRAAIDVIAPGGRLVAVGLQKETHHLDLARLTRLEHEIIGTNGLDVSSDLHEAIRLVAARTKPWSDVAPQVLSLEDLVADGLSPARKGTPNPVKILASPWAQSSRLSRM